MMITNQLCFTLPECVQMKCATLVVVDETMPDATFPISVRSRKKPYKELTLEEKVNLIRLAENNPQLSQAAIAEHYKIAKSNVCRILQRRHEYLAAFHSDLYTVDRKRKLRLGTLLLYLYLHCSYCYLCTNL